MSEKILLIVGAGPGISLNTARKFGKEGFKVSLISRSMESLQKYENELKIDEIAAKRISRGCLFSRIFKKTAIDTVIKTYGKIDVLLYNAASGSPGKPTTLSVDQLVEDFKISVAEALTSVKEVIPHMQNGTIFVNGWRISSSPLC
ncbi:hypothetical protein GCM10020331_094890 [Ectobacillus funiculus]